MHDKEWIVALLRIYVGRPDLCIRQWIRLLFANGRKSKVLYSQSVNWYNIFYFDITFWLHMYGIHTTDDVGLVLVLRSLDIWICFRIMDDKVWIVALLKKLYGILTMAGTLSFPSSTIAPTMPTTISNRLLPRNRRMRNVLYFRSVKWYYTIFVCFYWFLTLEWYVSIIFVIISGTCLNCCIGNDCI